METLTNDFITGARKAISDANHILILTHKNPDGDALGSGLALFHLFGDLKKKVTFITPNHLPVYLNWMTGISDVIVYESHKELGKELIKESDLILMVDFNHRSRLSEVGDVVIPHRVPKIMIDHHPNPEDISTFLYSRTNSSSTAEMVFEFIEQLFGENYITKTIAESLFVGIMTDTGSFSYNSSEPLTFSIVGKLLNKGVQKDDITDNVYNNFSEMRLRMLGHAVNTRMIVLPEYHTAYIYLTKKDLEDYAYEPGDTEGFVNYPLSIRGIVFSAIFIEREGFTKCSFRSKGNFPSNLVAKEHFNGGGHLNASGGESKMSITESLKKFENVLPDYKKYFNPSWNE